MTGTMAGSAQAAHAQTAEHRSSLREEVQPSVGRGDQIVAAAYDLLAEEGLEGLTVRAVLSRTGVNRRTFYERFSGKDDLVLAVFEQSLRAVADDCRRRTAPLPDPLSRLRLILDYLVLGVPAAGAEAAGDTRRSAALCREHMRLAEARPAELGRALRPLIQLLAEELAAGIAAGQVRDRPPERLAVFVYNLVSTTVHAEVLARDAGEPERTHRAQLSDDLWEFCIRGVAP